MVSKQPRNKSEKFPEKNWKLISKNKAKKVPKTILEKIWVFFGFVTVFLCASFGFPGDFFFGFLSDLFLIFFNFWVHFFNFVLSNAALCGCRIVTGHYHVWSSFVGDNLEISKKGLQVFQCFTWVSNGYFCRWYSHWNFKVYVWVIIKVFSFPSKNSVSSTSWTELLVKSPSLMTETCVTHSHSIPSRVLSWSDV